MLALLAAMLSRVPAPLFSCLPGLSHYAHELMASWTVTQRRTKVAAHSFECERAPGLLQSTRAHVRVGVSRAHLAFPTLAPPHFPWSVTSSSFPPLPFPSVQLLAYPIKVDVANIIRMLARFSAVAHTEVPLDERLSTFGFLVQLFESDVCR